MDCSWLIEDDGDEDPESDSDSEETQAELETRLYSIVHHCDLSQPLPVELAKHYSVQCGDDGKLTVALNNSLENIKSEEVKTVGNLVNGPRPDEVSEVIGDENLQEKDDVILISDTPLNSEISKHKRFRYSDVNLDLPKVSLEISEVNDTGITSPPDIINYFKITPSFLNIKKVKRLRNLVIPSSFQTDHPPDWKDTANESFISVGGSGTENEIIEKMVCALKKENPKISTAKLYYFSRTLFFHNRKKHEKNQRRRLKKAGESTLNVSLEIKSDSDYKSKVIITKNSKNVKHDSVDTLKGSVSLNISPFKPLLPTVDLVSEDEVDSAKRIAVKSTIKWKSLPKSGVPSKWSKKMIKFYTKPSTIKMEMELNQIFENLRRNTTNDDWKLDPRDEVGVYQRTPIKGKHRHRRCPNCHNIGHLMRDCPSPRKVSCCYLCGQNYHYASSCPNKVCLKCGVYVTNEEYECSSCYYNTFNYDTPCGICGQNTHQSNICPDLWRSFHATVEGDKIIPQEIVENMRRYCCNCATKGHFSHQCPYPSYERDHISSFVTNYSGSPRESGTTEIVIPRQFSHIVHNTNADMFLQRLSDSTNAVIDMEENQTNLVFRVSGTFEQCRKVKNEIEEYVNIKKRKMQDRNMMKRKRRKMR